MVFFGIGIDVFLNRYLRFRDKTGRNILQYQINNIARISKKEYYVIYRNIVFIKHKNILMVNIKRGFI